MPIVVKMERTTQPLWSKGALLQQLLSKKGGRFRLMKNSNLPREPKRSEMTGEERVRDFQRKLYRKAKEDKAFRFYSLYDKICLKHVIEEAYRRVFKNKGAPGVDGMTFSDIIRGGQTKFLEDIRQELLDRTYQPQPVQRVMIPKANGSLRPLGIPTIKDRVVQMACKLVIEPIFEADFHDGSFGFRPKRSAKDAVKRIKDNLQSGRCEVYDADLSSYFDTIPHEKLMILVAKRISDKRVLHLIKLWLKTPVMEEGKISGGKKNKKGTPQGGVISPLLANIYLNLVDTIISKMENFTEAVRIVRYADDFVLMGKELSKRIMEKLHGLLAKMDLTINQEKTRQIDARQEKFNFLGFTYHCRISRYDGLSRYYHITPATKSVSSLRAKIRKCLKENNREPRTVVIEQLNPIIRGWFNYYHAPRLSYIGSTVNAIDKYLWESLYRFHKRKSQRYNAGYCRSAYTIWKEKFNLVNPRTYCRAKPSNA